MTPGYRASETIKAHRRGWALTPLRGKVPILTGWQNASRPSFAQAVAWAQEGNIGIRTGAVSGLVVIDVDSAKGGEVKQLKAPPTVTVITGSGGQHLYFRHPGERVRNSVGKLAPHVDVRGDGGQVVAVGSVHPETGRVYRWASGRSPDDLPLADLPEHILGKLCPPRRHPRTHAPFIPANGKERTTCYGRAALAAEVERVRSAPEGDRNDQLNRSSFALGRLVGGGVIEGTHATDGLVWAAREVGLSDAEAIKTIHSGMTAGRAHPRSPR